MLTSKNRADIKAKLNSEPAVCFVGKEGLTDNVVKSIELALNAREAIKISLMQNCDYDTKELSSMICERLSAETVSLIGRKILIYRYSPNLSKHVLEN